MNYKNIVQFELSGRYALFTDPITKSGGEKCSLLVPTYGALKGAADRIYSSREFQWVIDAVRILNPIVTESMTLTRLNYFDTGKDISVYTYLRDVRYKVLAHMQLSDNADEADEHRLYSIARRMLKKGGRRQVYLGTASCPASVTPCRFNEGSGCYDDISECFGLMHHSFTYPTEQSPSLTANMFYCKMDNGIITFPPPSLCPISRVMKGAPELALV